MSGLKELIGKDINKYTITKYINSGSFGNVFEARHRKTGDIVALKMPIKTEERNGEKSLLEEAKVYDNISSKENGIASMKVVKHKEQKVIVMDLLGSSLESLMVKYKRFKLINVIYLAIMMIDIMKYIHSCGYLHRDIKPDNFVLGINDEKDKLYCIDFGLAKRYLDKNSNHVAYKENHKFCGTARYASIAAHKGYEQSRKDDLESLGYLFVYMYKGKLPWQNVKHKDKNERYRIIGERKEAISEEDLCSDMPREFLVYLKYVRNLDFDEKPLYTSCRNMFKRLYDSHNYTNDNLDW